MLLTRLGKVAEEVAECQRVLAKTGLKYKVCHFPFYEKGTEE